MLDGSRPGDPRQVGLARELAGRPLHVHRSVTLDQICGAARRYLSDTRYARLAFVPKRSERIPKGY